MRKRKSALKRKGAIKEAESFSIITKGNRAHYLKSLSSDGDICDSNSLRRHAELRDILMN
jgi:hypothetical protein